jgi:hypothetical protein
MFVPPSERVGPVVTVPVFNGTVTETLSGAPVLGFTTVVTGSRVTISAPGYLTRDTALTAASVDLVREAAFDLGFYRQFVRNTFAEPDTMQPLRRQRQSPRVYVRTVDESGAPVTPSALKIVVDNITPGLIDAFSGGTLTLAGLEQGTETRVGSAGWITVVWPTSFPDGRCGQAVVGGDKVEVLNVSDRDRCRMYPRLIKHELGHAMGFWHTDQRNDVMFSSSSNDYDNNPSARERHHAAIAYARPIGSLDVDVDPGGSARVLAPVVVD